MINVTVQYMFVKYYNTNGSKRGAHGRNSFLAGAVYCHVFDPAHLIHCTAHWQSGGVTEEDEQRVHVTEVGYIHYH